MRRTLSVGVVCNRESQHKLIFIVSKSVQCKHSETSLKNLITNPAGQLASPDINNRHAHRF